MIAALQMYDWPEVQPRLDEFWTDLAEDLHDLGIDAPASLSRPADLGSAWNAPDLLVGQTCGLPYVSNRCGSARLLARPDFNLQGAHGGTYSSALICRADDNAATLGDFRSRTAAINEIGSQSGCNALADAVLDASDADDPPFFAQVTRSGSHRRSADLVVGGTADLAAIDAVAWALYAEVEPEHHARLRVINWTRSMPALPYITAHGNSDVEDTLFGALSRVVFKHADVPRRLPLPVGVLAAVDTDYDPIRAMAVRVSGMQLAPGMPSL
ncbi:MAG: PhnD/SsuA/transferrin family substrate-binding protein [Pseudomonadota bacterium]